MTRLEAQKESLAQELVEASRSADKLANIVSEYELAKQQYKEMEQKYNALLQVGIFLKFECEMQPTL